MMVNRIQHWSFWAIVFVSTLLLSGCNSGGGDNDGSDSITETTSNASREYVLVWSDEFNQGTSPSVEKWTIETGYGDNGWGNDESQLYTDSPDNVRVENGNLVITARCDSGVCGVRDGSITSARINTKDKFEVKYGKIQARIKPPRGKSTWPAFWMLGSNFPDENWPGVGEIDIMEMHQFFSNDKVTHFTMHWSGPKYTQEIIDTEEIFCANLSIEGDTPSEGQNCFTDNKEFDFSLTDDFHVFEAEWDENQITGKIDDIVYFRQTIDPDEMEEFLNSFFIILNIAIDGNLGGPPEAIITTPQEMLVDWVRVYRISTSDVVGLLSEDPQIDQLGFDRIRNSVEIGGNFVEVDVNSTAVTPKEGSKVIELDYTTANAFFSGAAFELNTADLSGYNTILFSINTSQFTDFGDIQVELIDSRNNGDALGKESVSLSSYTPTISGNWHSYEIPLSDFVGVNLDDITSFGFWNPVDSTATLASGLIYLDDIRLERQECNITPTVSFDASSYQPSANVAQLSVSDPCSPSTLATIKVENSTDEIVVGADLDAAGQGAAIIEFGSPVSLCPVGDSTSSIVLEDPLITSYFSTASDGTTVVKANSSASIDPNATPTVILGEQSYIFANDSSQATAFSIDIDFSLSDFGSGSTFNSAYIDPAFPNPVWSVSDRANEAAVFAMFNFTSGFTSGQESINFKVKDMPGDIVLVKFGDADPDFSVDLVNDTNFSTPIGSTGWYEVSIPMANFPTVDSYNYLVIKSNTSSASDFRFLVTDIFLQESVGSRGPECDAPTTAAPAPTNDPNDVISLLSSVYTAGAVVDTWAQFGTATLFETTLQGTEIKRYANLGFVGVQTESNPIDLSGMTNLRLDVWSTQVTQLRTVLVDFLGDGFGGTNGDSEAFVISTLTPGEWTSIDIPLTDFTSAGLASTTDINQMILAAESGSGTLFVNNVYYYGAGTGGGPGGGTGEGVVPEVVLFSSDPVGSPVDLVFGIDYTGYNPFGSGSTFDAAFTGDSTYGNVFAVTTGSGYTVPVGQLAFEGFTAGFADGVYDELVFKVKGVDSDLIRVKFLDPPGNPYVDVTLTASSSEYTATDIGDGWYQVAIPIDSSFGDISASAFLIFENNTAATNYTFYLTDIGFNNAATGITPDVFLFSLDPVGSPVDLVLRTDYTGYNLFGSGSTFDAAFTGDSTYGNV
ncbi:MAG: glycoside hydrolase family 16 protein, partial [Candidatus Thiodiazotropha sp. (ex. Lucinisca nassula)]|nr:glycoside hydrolase family 16 protein [Candidatus Thiodiazotropha sp. (ex. Lucinisca nassula)]